jgi:nitroimidazol reductase NimA-like FMN-containing flavoprotein (pyridoxamine 5'-phosphate oxidase superfamily)
MIGSLNRYQIDNLLRSEMVGRIGCHAGGLTYVIPITYVYDGNSIFVHTREGLKVTMMRENPEVCFEVDRIDNMANWQSVVLLGTYHELKGKEAEGALLTIGNRIHPLTASMTSLPRHSLDRPDEPINPADIKMVVFRIEVKERSGRFEKQ